MPSNPARNLARAVEHQRQQEQHAVDSSLLAAMASASDESPGGEGTMNGDELRGLGARGGAGLRDSSRHDILRWSATRSRFSPKIARLHADADLLSRTTTTPASSFGAHE